MKKTASDLFKELDRLSVDLVDLKKDLAEIAADPELSNRGKIQAANRRVFRAQTFAKNMMKSLDSAWYRERLEMDSEAVRP